MNDMFQHLGADSGKGHWTIVGCLVLLCLHKYGDDMVRLPTIRYSGVSDRWYISVRAGVMTVESSFSSRGWTLSRPAALWGLRFLSRFSTPLWPTLMFGISGYGL